MIREWIAGLGCAALALLPAASRAAEPSSAVDLAFVAEPRFGIEPGVLSTESARHLLVWWASQLPSPISIDERSVGGRLSGVLLRGTRLVFLDLPLVEVETGFVHEVFGHGARGREYGASPSYTFNMPRPYRWIFEPDDTDSFGARTDIGPGQHHSDYDLMVRLGGIEANYFLAHRIATELVQDDGLVQQSDLLVYAVNKLVYGPSFADPDPADLSTGNDVDNYIRDLANRFNRWRPEQAASVAAQLRTAYLWNLADPLLLYAAYATLVPWLVGGESVTRVPLPRIDGTAILPLPRFNLTPFGAEHLLGVVFARRDWVAEVYGRVGSSGLASYTGAGVSIEGLRASPSVSLGAALDGWSQPELLPSERNAYEREQRIGGSAALRATWMFADHFGLTGKLAVKTRGYLAAQPIDVGPYGFAGLAVRLPGGELDEAP